jgi:hypothetical protein
VVIRKKTIFDPEVAALVSEVRALVGQAYSLSQQIQHTVGDLEQYVNRVQPEQAKESDG